LGTFAGSNTQGANSVAIGTNAGNSGQGVLSIAIGFEAGRTNQPNNSIILNATGNDLNANVANTFVVKPIRNEATVPSGFVQLYYDKTTGEIISVG
jgi:hypothetical protein